MGGSNLVLKYNCSAYHLLSAVFPEHEWLPWRFENCPEQYWGDVNNQRKFMDWAMQYLRIKEMSDWYYVSVKVLKGNFSII